MLEIMKREWKLLITEKQTVLLVLLFAASAYALLIGNLYGGAIVQNIPVAVCDLEDSLLSRELVRSVMEADQYEYVETLTDEFQAIEKLNAGKLAGVLIIPKDFSKRFYSQQPIELAFMQDGSNTLQSSYALSPMQLVIGNFVAKYANQAAISNNVPQISPSAVSMSVRAYGNPTQSYSEFYVYGVMLVATQIGMIMGFSMSVYEDYHQGYFAQKGVGLTLFSKAVFYLIMSFSSVVIGIFLLASIYKLPFRGDISDTLILCLSFLFLVESLSGLAALYFKTKLALVQCMVFYTLPAFLTSGYIWPEIGMIDIIKWISIIQPVHYILMDFRDLALVGESATCFSHTVILFLIGMIFMLILYALLHYLVEVPKIQKQAI